MRGRISLFILLLCITAGALAKQATPMAKNPQLEVRVMELAAELRCLVCQNQTIADSDAGLAVDLKNQIREMLAEGKTDDEVIDYMVQRYGDFVRFRPPMKATTVLLWFGPLLLFIAGGVLLIVNLRRRGIRLAVAAPLSEEQNKRLEKLLTTDGEDGRR